MAAAQTSTTGFGAGLPTFTVSDYLLKLWYGSPQAPMIRQHPALTDLTKYANFKGTQGSVRFQKLGLDGYDTMSAVSEGAAVPITALSYENVSISTSRYVLGRAYSDEARGRDPHMVLNPFALALDVAKSANRTMTKNIAAMASGLSRVRGASGSAFTHNNFMDCKGDLGNVGGALWITSVIQFNQWLQDLEARSGVTQWRPATAEMMGLSGDIFKGRYDNVDIVALPDADVVDDGTDFTGMMIAQGCIGFAEEIIAPSENAHVIAQANALIVEGERQAGGVGVDNIYGCHRVGFTELEDLLGVRTRGRNTL